MTAQASPDLPADPILRLDPEGHFAAITRIDVDAQGLWLVSGSHDKTVKVWRLADGALERTLHLPQGPGHLGKVYAAAISPDGKQVAAGGWTGYERWGGHSIYVFDRASGSLTHRIEGLPNATLHLAFSPDGTRLAATLGEGGLRLYETSAYAEIARDPDYGNRSFWADFADDGRLVTSSDDGKLRLYGPDGALERTGAAPGGEHPYGATFSPDGTRIAVGYDDSTRVDVLDTATLELNYSADTAGADNGNLCSVVWSADGRSLLAGGRYDVGGWSPIRRWSEGGRGPFEEFKVTTDTVMDLRALPDGRLAVGTTDKVALLSPDGETLWERPTAIADFRGQRHGEGIRLSATGDVLAFGYEQWGKRPVRFSLPERSLTLDPKDISGLILPEEGPLEGLAVTDWEDEYTPRLNGRPLALAEFETSRSLATAPDGRHFVLGTEWWLRAFAAKEGDPDGAVEQLWEQPVPGAAWAVNISGDGRYAVAGYGDGTLRWHRMGDGAEVLALYPHPDGKRWVLWTPQGYYQASAGGEDLIGWHVNQGAGKAPEFFSISRFRDQYYRRDVIARVLETGDPLEALRLADRARGKATRTGTVAELLPPTIAILSPAPDTSVDTQKLILLYKSESSDSPIASVEARIDGRPAEVLEHVQPSVSDDRRKIVGQITLAIPPRDGVAELIARNAHAASEPAAFRVQWGGGADAYKPSLYVLATGVSEYPEEKVAPLRYAAKDARAFAEVLAGQEGGLYKAVQTRLLTDGAATREAIREGLNWLRREVGERDVAVIFLAGHGINDDGYYFISVDADPLDPLFTALGDEDLRKFLGRVAGKTVLMIDTCFSGGLDPGTRAGEDSLPDIDKLANELADAETGVVVYSSSTGKEKSLEDEAWGHGAFTYALLEAVREGKADFTGNGHVTILELGTYLDDCVKRLTDGRQHPTITLPPAVRDRPMFRVHRLH